MHGKLKPKEKAAVMEDFRTGQLDALVSTTVIEVGVDVPNATVMVIENAERYGLSALHQLRGRVGRGAAESWCFLVSDNEAESVRSRLKFLCSTTDGFAVAQYDLETGAPATSSAAASTACRPFRSPTWPTTPPPFTPPRARPLPCWTKTLCSPRRNTPCWPSRSTGCLNAPDP